MSCQEMFIYLQMGERLTGLVWLTNGFQGWMQMAHDDVLRSFCLGLDQPLPVFCKLDACASTTVYVCILRVGGSIAFSRGDVLVGIEREIDFILMPVDRYAAGVTPQCADDDQSPYAACPY